MHIQKIIKLLVLAILISLLHVQKSHACATRLFSKDPFIECPANIENALSEVGLKPSISIKCQFNAEYRDFKHNGINFITVYYHPPELKEHCPTSLLGYNFIQNQSGELQFVSSSYTEVSSYASDQLKTPFFEGLADISLKKFSSREVKKIDTAYCFTYSLKFPYEGTIYDCPSKEDKKQNTVYGKIKYAEGALKWIDAYRLVLMECPKYFNSVCNPPNDGTRAYRYFGGLHANSVMKLNKNKNEIEYYLFAMPFYINQGTKYEGTPISGHNEGMILVKVTKEGEVKSQEMEHRSYKSEDLFELDKKYF